MTEQEYNQILKDNLDKYSNLLNEEKRKVSILTQELIDAKKEIVILQQKINSLPNSEPQIIKRTFLPKFN